MKNIVILCCLLICKLSFAQKSILRTLMHQTQLHLRWAPTDINNTLPFVRSGCVITIKDSANKLLTCDTLLPWKKNDKRWESLIETNKKAEWAQHLLLEGETNHSQIQSLLLVLADQDSTLSRALALGKSYPLTTKGFVKVEWKSLFYNETLSEMVFCHDKDLPQISFNHLKCKSHSAELGWEEKPLRSIYSHYRIERVSDSVLLLSEPQMQLFSECENDKTHFWYLDTALSVNHTYRFRVYGISPFGVAGPLSEPKTCYTFPDLQNPPQIDSLIFNQDTVVLHYRLTEKEDYDLVDHFLVEMDSAFSGNYAKKIKSSVSPFVFSLLENNDKCRYFKIAAIHKNGDTLRSYPELLKRIDSIPPLAPILTTATIDSIGKVNLHWQDNKEIDLLGYRVFRRNNVNEEFVELSTSIITGTSFTDTISIRTLTKSVEYTLRAVDNNYNASEFSKSIVLQRPDKIAPPPAQFLKLDQIGDSLLFSWTACLAEDFYSYRLVQKNNTHTDSILYQGRENFFSMLVSLSGLYHYQLITLDSSLNQSQSKIIPKHLNVQPPSITIDSVKVDLNYKFISLFWTPAQSSFYALKIYRSKNHSPFIPLFVTEEPITYFNDKQLQIGNNYTYRLEYVYWDGSKQLSEEKTIHY